MKSCKQCVHFAACNDWAIDCFGHDTEFPYEVDDSENLCDHYNPITLPPAYIGMKVWMPWVFSWPELHTDLCEGHVSGLQQKANGSWKIRCTRKGTVADYTVEEFNKYCFLNKDDAEKYIEEKVKGYTNG